MNESCAIYHTGATATAATPAGIQNAPMKHKVLWIIALGSIYSTWSSFDLAVGKHRAIGLKTRRRLLGIWNRNSMRVFTWYCCCCCCYGGTGYCTRSAGWRDWKKITKKLVGNDRLGAFWMIGPAFGWPRLRILDCRPSLDHRQNRTLWATLSRARRYQARGTTRAQYQWTLECRPFWAGRIISAAMLMMLTKSDPSCGLRIIAQFKPADKNDTRKRREEMQLWNAWSNFCCILCLFKTRHMSCAAHGLVMRVRHRLSLGTTIHQGAFPARPAMCGVAYGRTRPEIRFNK